MGKSIIDLLLDNIFDDKWTGQYGEWLTANELGWAKLFGRKGKTLRNVYLPANEGETSELDVIYITQKGIFIFESKNYSGWIFGDEKSRNWTVSLPNRQKYQFYNPIMQNRTHLKWMKNYVGEEIPLFSIIVFSERCKLKKVTVYSEDIKVIKRNHTYAAVKEFWDKNPDAVSEEKIAELYEALKKLTNVDSAIKEAHVKNIESKYKNDKVTKLEDVSNDITANTYSVKMQDEAEAEKNEEEQVVEQNTADEEKAMVEEKLCPKCGSKLILRTAKKGDNAGNQFYGCSAFPKCRYIQNI